MKYAESLHRPKRHDSRNDSQRPAGVAITPPGYGIDLIDRGPRGPIQRKENNGLPDRLKKGVEHLSGFTMDDVRVHYNSSKPAQLQALAYTRGADIHIGPGQEKHLAHEAWHVVQQKKDRVRATTQLRGMGINDEPALEREAEVMGKKAWHIGGERTSAPAFQVSIPSGSEGCCPVVQRKVGFEFETGVYIKTTPTGHKVPYDTTIFRSTEVTNPGWVIKSDNSKVEFVTEPIDDNSQGYDRLISILVDVTSWARSMCETTLKAEPERTGKIKDVDPSLGRAIPYKKEDIVLDDPGVSEDALVASPQATGGITLAKIPQLVDEMVNVKLALGNSETYEPTDNPNTAVNKKVLEVIKARGYDTKDILHSVGGNVLAYLGVAVDSKGLVDDWLETVEDLTDNDKEWFESEFEIPIAEVREKTRNLQGLLTLVISYLIGGSILNRALDYTKEVTIMMSRTDIYSLHKLLNPLEKKIFTAENVLHISKLKDGLLFPKGINYNDKTYKGPLRSAWINSIIKGHKERKSDMLSQKSKYPLARTATSMGAYQQPDVDPRSKNNLRQLAVLELRNIPEKQGIEDWPVTAVLIFNLFRRLNEQ